MKRILSLLLASLIILPTFNLFGCTKASGEKTILRVCNCEDYIDETLLDDFEAEYPDIDVIYSTYGTNENLYNELVINPNSYDLVVPSEYMIEKLAVEGRIQKLNADNIYQSYLDDYKQNLSPFIESRLKDIKVGGQTDLYDYMVGYMWGTMGWVYNTENVSVDDVKNWFSPFLNGDLDKKITIKDSVRDSYIVGLAMAYQQELYDNAGDTAEITRILNKTDKTAIGVVGETLSSLKSKLYGFEVDSGKNDIILGRIDAYVAWSGDAAYAIDVASGEVENDDGTIVENVRDLSYYVPDEGSNIWFDGFVMPSGSRNYDAVYKFLEFISRPENVYRNMNYTGYTGMVANGEFTMADEETGEEYQTDLFNEVVLGWFDESEDQDPETVYHSIDLSYFFDPQDTSGAYEVVVSEEGLGRLIAQYPTLDIVERCAVMSYFDGETLMDIIKPQEDTR